MRSAARYRRIVLYLLMIVPAAVCLPVGLAAVDEHVGAVFMAAPVMISGMMVLYLIAHCLRAVRLALLTASAFDVSARTTFLLHLFTAPVALVLPFKLGEVFRLQQLIMVTGRPVGSLIVLLLDRVLDAVILLPIFLYIVATDESRASAGQLGLVALLSLVLICAGAAFLAAPEASRTVQQYIFLRHRRPRARLVLGWLSAIGDVLDRSVRSLRTNLAVLIALSLAIWSLEVGATFILLGVETARTVLSATLAVLERAMFEWPTAVPPSQSSKATAGFAALAFLALMIPWPLVAMLYVRRVHNYCLADPGMGRSGPTQRYSRMRA
jgi:hypothetical protein